MTTELADAFSQCFLRVSSKAAADARFRDADCLESEFRKMTHLISWKIALPEILPNSVDRPSGTAAETGD
jgi:hypothetical protein